MKRIQVLGAIAIIGLLQACAVNKYSVTDKEGNTIKLTQYIFVQKAAVDGLRVSPKTGLSIKAADSETQNEVIQGIVQTAVATAIKAAK